MITIVSNGKIKKLKKSPVFNDKIWHSTPFVAPLIVFD